jgi:hypothetical protein
MKPAVLDRPQSYKKNPAGTPIWWGALAWAAIWTIYWPCIG